MVNAAIITIGDEILIGQIIDTNSALISRKLGEIGIKTEIITSIADNSNIIYNTLSNYLAKYDIVVTTGGLGPTKDDITKDVIYKISGSSSYRENADQKEIIYSILHSRGLEVLPANISQAMVPDKCNVILNKRGTAPIMAVHFPESRFNHRAVLYCMPGVPFETEAALEDVLIDIKQNFSLSSILHKTIMTYGLAESALASKISEWEDSLPDNIKLAYLPNPITGVRLRLSCYNDLNNGKRIDEEISKLMQIIPEYIYSLEDSSLQAEIGKVLKGKTISTAESCTGGMIAHLLTTVGGSSEYFKGSVVSYSEEIKEKILGVSSKTIAEKGIVSSDVARQMAEGVRKLLNTTYSVSTTGWADRYGDEKEPAGTVWVAVSGPKGTETFRFNYKNDRKRNIERFAASALYELLKFIKEDCPTHQS